MQYTINYYTDFIKKLKDKEGIIIFAIFRLCKGMKATSFIISHT